MQVRLNVVQGRGEPRELLVDAPSVDAARLQATHQGLAVLSADASGLQLGDWAVRLRPAPIFDVAVLVEQLRDLLVAGLSVIEALDALHRGGSGAAAIVVGGLRRRLQQGLTLSSAFEADAAFPALLVALVRAAELTSDLPSALSRFIEHEQRAAEVRHRVVSTSIYPLLLVGVGGLVLLFLLFYVMPRFARIFEGMSGELPWSAKAMVAWAQALRAHTVWWIAGAIAVLLGVGAVLSSSTVRSAIMHRSLSWGPLRRPLNTYFLARWYRATGMLAQGGIPLPQSLNLANALLPVAMQLAGRAAEQGLREGLAPSAAYARAGMSTPVAEQLLVAGERTGDLGTVLTRIAHFHEAEVQRALDKGLRALEPVVMVLIGLGVGLVVVLMYMPIFELAAAVQ